MTRQLSQQSSNGVPAREWTDEDGDPLGSWVEIDAGEWRDLMLAAGGLQSLAVFSSLTDPEGQYGPAQVYTAWGHREDAFPLIDVRDYKAEDGSTERHICRKFVPRPDCTNALGSFQAREEKP